MFQIKKSEIRIPTPAFQSSVEYPCERSNVHRPKRQDKSKTNLKIKRKQKEQKLRIQELLYKTGVGSGALEGEASPFLRATPVVGS